ncbi:SDR family oxidoreductase [Flavilitoribacter nigricans]|uniref:Thioester reductase (TE) domain-containing protein n=1 Tax=Flavilitoribacter nigricans (strain ATCC 23147 / DSM 23189 / NBRC 102662 / NCIMB 1420 / SS-2) TaxID=1122177 RepID=A0A2D0NI22_FLAN2|nr:SDR family oxidoreductase [Flavilitoribacter nigricans]PHN08131.1 hypothetical protein CRP01_02075 [Flavilitoribacter nigricans DSM 23189 = NBRC 102662]
MTQSHFITGATGFVGSYVLIELLKQTNDTIYCLVRPKEDQAPEARIFGLLDKLIPAYQENPALLAAARRRVRIVAGDLSESVLEIAPRIESPINCFWHVAASLNYEERFADQIFETNVMGTHYALRLAKKLQTQYFNHFSTAYVVGKQQGIMREEVVRHTESNNAYERSKVTSELEVLSATGMQTRIFRPSIVIGHSLTHEAFNFSGMYGFLRRLVQFRGMMERIQTGYLDRNPIRMKMDPQVPLNLVPVDQVAQEAVQIGTTAAPQRIFNLTNKKVLTVGETIGIMFDIAGVSQPEIVRDAADFNWIDEKFNEKMEFYNSYLVGRKVFDRRNTDAALQRASDHDQYAITRDRLVYKSSWYLNKLLSKRVRIPVSR